MPTVVTCPECDSTLKLKAAIAPGKRVKCPSCQEIFSPSPSESESRVSDAPTRRGGSMGYRDTSADDFDVGSEPSRTRGRPGRGAPSRERDDDSEGRPRPRRPRRSRRTKSGGGLGKAAPMLLGVGGLLGIVGLIVVLVVFVFPSKLNKDNFDKIKVGMSKGEVEDILGSPDDTDMVMGMEAVSWGRVPKDFNLQGDTSDVSKAAGVIYQNGKVIFVIGIFDGEMTQRGSLLNLVGGPGGGMGGPNIKMPNFEPPDFEPPGGFGGAAGGFPGEEPGDGFPGAAGGRPGFGIRGGAGAGGIAGGQPGAGIRGGVAGALGGQPGVGIRGGAGARGIAGGQPGGGIRGGARGIAGGQPGGGIRGGARGVAGGQPGFPGAAGFRGGGFPR